MSLNIYGLTVAFLINRMPSGVLNFQTPINVFKQMFPTSRLLTDIPLKVFGCTVFVHNHSLHCGKLDPRAHAYLLATAQHIRGKRVLIQFQENSLLPWMSVCHHF